jgi:hypothetical protein
MYLHRYNGRKREHGTVKVSNIWNPGQGIVVGCRWKCAGVRAQWIHGDTTFTTTGKALVLLVLPGYSNKPVEVCPQHATTIEPGALPAFWYPEQAKEHARQEYRENTADYPRDPQTGRFTRG